MPERMGGPSRAALEVGLGAEEATRPLVAGTGMPPQAHRDPRRFAAILCTEIELGLASLARRMEVYNPNLVQGLSDLRARAAKLASDVDVQLRELLACDISASAFLERRDQLAWTIRKDYTLLGSGIQSVRDSRQANPVQRRSITELQEGVRATSGKLQALVEGIRPPQDHLLLLHTIPDFEPQDFDVIQ